jgi:NADPH:quinone reductase-like Zn-dependent oxidoreductase
VATVVQYSRIGGPEVLEVVEVPTPSAPADGVVVEVQAVGLNPVDIKQRAGRRATPPITEPRRTGADAAGVITEVGDNVTDWNVGDKVIVVGASGTYTSHLVAKTSQLEPKPSVWTWEQAAGVGIPVGTAYQALRSLGVTSGTRLLIHAGSGAVGQAAIQFAVAWGASVVATAGEANQDRVRELGATPVVYGDGLTDRVREVAPDGIDTVLDAAGTDEALQTSFELVADRSHIGTVVAGDRAAELGIRAWSGGNPIPLTDEEQRLRREGISAAAELAAQGKFDVEIGARFALADAADAQRASEGGGVRGKIVLIP